MQTLLVIDDEPSVLYSLRKRLESPSLRVITAETAEAGLELARTGRPDAVILDVRLPDMSGLDCFDRLHQESPLLPVIIITAFSTTETAIEAMKRGAFEYLLKPVDFHLLRDVTGKALEAGRARHLAERSQRAGAEPPTDRIIGQSACMQELYKSIGRVAAQDVTVLLLGESGTGKELVARTIYEHSKRNRSPYLAVNCAALTESLLESELFGHEQGAFTGADRRRVGKFEQVHGGTIFLDEVGDMSPATQAKVLRLLQGGEFERVGGRETVRADVRVIAATNRDLEAMVNAGTFRRDLYYRLNGLTITLPPLRERLDDIPLLVEHFAAQLSAKLGRHVVSIAPDVLQLLASCDWPGNVRELENVVRYSLIHARGNSITLASLPQMLASAAGIVAPAAGDRLNLVPFIRESLKSGVTDLYRVVQAEVDRVLLREVLAHVEGNQVHASQLLGISRSTLRSKLGLNRVGDAIEMGEAPTVPAIVPPEENPISSGRT